MTFIDNLTAKFGVKKENEIHPHLPEERADLFHSADPTATEYETLNFLRSFIISTKPTHIVETGTHVGFGTIAIADAIKYNGFGKLWTIEYIDNYRQQAIANVKKYDESLLDHVNFILADTREWLKNTDLQFDFGFFDSELAYRHIEFNIIKDNLKYNAPFWAMFHDTARNRSLTMGSNSSKEMIQELDNLSLGKEWMEFPYSRGFRILKLNS